MTLLRRLPLALALSALLAGPAQAQSLLALVEQAQGYDAAWQAARAQLDAATSRAGQARAGLLPTVGVSAGVTQARSEVTPGNLTLDTPNRNLMLAASQPLYRPANRIGYEQGQRGIEVAQAQLDAAQQDLLVRVSQAYFDVLAAQDTLAFVQAQKAAVAEQLAAARRNFEVGTSTITDQREAQARHDLVSAKEIAAANDLHVKRLALDQVVGKSGTAPQPLQQPVHLPPVALGAVEDWVQKSQDLQPLVRQAQLALDVAELETQKARTGHLPTLDLQAGYKVDRYPKGTPTIPGVNMGTNTASVGVALNVPLFAGFAVQQRVQETVSLAEKARADLENARRSTAQGTRTAFFGLQSGAGQVQALEAAEASSQSALEANQMGYQVGVRINIDVLNAQSQLFETKRDLAVARYNLLMGQLKLRQAAGTLQLSDLNAINALLAP
ncbi:MAG: TolC family outer membrane protein [Comamonadaceae bacterium]|jgi:outer membrane protein|nr:TolC family outer membrane protein [Comamonadaceae bacterium]